MARSTIPRRATQYTQIDGRRCSWVRLTAHEAAAAIRRERKQPRKVVDAVHVYATTDRDGTPLHIGYVHYTPGYWSRVADVINVYEIPTAALTDL